VSAAARALGVSPGAISQQIHKLEKQVGLTLLQRNGNRMLLTTWGQVYHDKVAEGLSILQDATTDLIRARDTLGLTISSLSSVINKWIGREIFDWHRNFPEAQIRMVGSDIEPNLRDGDVDFRIYYGELHVHDTFTELYTDWVVPACAPSLLQGRALGDPSEILQFPLLNIVWKTDLKAAPTWREWAQSVDIEFTENRQGLTHALSSSAIGAAVAGRGFVLAQYSFIGDELSSGRLVIPFDRRISLKDSYYLAWNRSALEKPHGKQFQRWLISLGRAQNRISRPPGN
jgi:LysR family glycine cleavage system transcriptional activator